MARGYRLWITCIAMQALVLASGCSVWLVSIGNPPPGYYRKQAEAFVAEARYEDAIAAYQKHI
ncbi:MAG: hypothetical protein KDD44_14970, partial [Bdellovibrionales bacterium]|nr:hypothetical protein [Bdellovibrionales bacterium]